MRHPLLGLIYLDCLSNCVSEKVNKQPEVINEAKVDCLCGRNWAEDPILGNSDLWVITCNVLRRRAVSGCLSDSISPTQSSAVHSLGLNCPISFRPDAQLFSAALFLSTGSSSTRENDTLIHTKWLSVSYKQVRILDRTTATHTSYFPLSDTHTHTFVLWQWDKSSLCISIINILLCHWVDLFSATLVLVAQLAVS